MWRVFKLVSIPGWYFIPRYNLIITSVPVIVSLLACPSLVLPSSSGNITCEPIPYCTGIECCVSIDFKFTKLFLNAWIEIDPCTLELSIGLGEWNEVVFLSASNWGVPKQVELGEALQIT